MFQPLQSHVSHPSRMLLLNCLLSPINRLNQGSRKYGPRSHFICQQRPFFQQRKLNIYDRFVDLAECNIYPEAITTRHRSLGQKILETPGQTCWLHLPTFDLTQVLLPWTRSNRNLWNASTNYEQTLPPRDWLDLTQEEQTRQIIVWHEAKLVFILSLWRSVTRGLWTGLL